MKKRSSSNPNQRDSSNNKNGLEEAMALLIRNQAAFLERAAESDRDMAALGRELLEQRRESDREMRELKRQTDERFRRIETILLEHTQLLQALPETIREKIGFKGTK